MDMKDALIEVKEFSNDNNELNESLIGLLRATSITVNVAKSIQSGKKVQQQSRELKQISNRLKVNRTQDDVQKTIAEGFSVLSELFINFEDMMKRNSYISASGGLFSDRTYNLIKKLEKRLKPFITMRKVLKNLNGNIDILFI